MSEFRPFGICINRREPLKSVFHAVAQGALVGLEFYQEVTALLPDSVDYVLLHGHGVGGDNLPCDIDFVNKLRHSLYLVAFFLTDLGRQCDAGIERICRHYIRIAPVHQDCPALGLAVNADYLSFTVRSEQFGMEGLDKLLHPLCHRQIVYAVFNTA